MPSVRAVYDEAPEIPDPQYLRDTGLVVVMVFSGDGWTAFETSRLSLTAKSPQMWERFLAPALIAAKVVNA